MKITKTFLVLCVAAFITGLTWGVASANPVMNWFETEKQKTIEFQKKGWQDGKDQFARTKQSILDLFKKVKGDESQN
tara:strand:+ start:164 stop:394 length:231 start_codon:yes stop_codon:yes gene_type:complete